LLYGYGSFTKEGEVPLIEPCRRWSDRFWLRHRNSDERNGKEAIAPWHLVKNLARLRRCSVTLPLWNDHGRAVDGIAFDRNQSFIGLIERKHGDFGLKIKLGGKAKKIAGIGPGHVRNAAQLAFSP
jgi:hypothetical protein